MKALGEGFSKSESLGDTQASGGLRVAQVIVMINRKHISVLFFFLYSLLPDPMQHTCMVLTG